MKTIKSEFIGTDATGKDFFRVIIVSESAPDSFPTSGADVDGVPDTAGIAAGSVLLTPDGNSVLYADGVDENTPGIKSIAISYNGSDVTRLGTLHPATPIYADAADDKLVDIVFEYLDAAIGEYEVTITPTQAGAIGYAADPEAEPTFLEAGEPWTFTVDFDDGGGSFEGVAAMMNAERTQSEFTIAFTIIGSPK